MQHKIQLICNYIKNTLQNKLQIKLLTNIKNININILT